MRRTFIHWSLLRTKTLAFSFCAFICFIGCKKEESVFAEADFSYSGDVTSLPARIEFINKSIGISYNWDFGDGNTSTLENPTHTYNEYGLYSVKLVVEGSNNIDSIKRVINIDVGTITALNCDSAIVEGNLIVGEIADSVRVLIPYTGGDGGGYNAQSINSTVVTGLTATLESGKLANGAGTLNFVITGTPNETGEATFSLSVGGQSCDLIILVIDAQPDYPSGTVHCTNALTIVVDVTNPITGKTWMDRNLGASRSAQSSTDAQAYGDLYQWGRGADGHQCRTSPTTSTLSSTDQPGHGDFILAPNLPNDWRSPQNTNLWQGVNGVNNPCPSGYRLPTETELNAERTSWSSNNAAGAFASPLKLPMAGGRDLSNGSLYNVGTNGRYWSSTVSGSSSRHLGFSSGGAVMSTTRRAYGRSVRCLKD